jgi:hypothetical protein
MIYSALGFAAWASSEPAIVERDRRLFTAGIPTIDLIRIT